jgi:hypothetical protein
VDLNQQLDDNVLQAAFRMDCVSSAIKDPDLIPVVVTLESVCQRIDDPCLVQAEFSLEGHGEFSYWDYFSGFSVDSTNGRNGSWWGINFETDDPAHTLQDTAEVRGKANFTAVWNMCTHLSTWLEESQIWVHLAFLYKSSVATDTFTPNVDT